MSSPKGTFFRADAVLQFLAKQKPDTAWTAYGVAAGIQKVDPGCSKHQARYALGLNLEEGYVEISRDHGGRATLFRATDKGRKACAR